jgi:class 3 adenylate cyclase
MRSHHATNLSGDGNDSLLVEEIAAQLYRQETNDGTSWNKLGPAERDEWRNRAEQYTRAVTSLGYRVDPAVQPHPEERNTVRLAAREAENLLGMGEPLLAYNALQNALAEHPADLRLRQLKGLALARSGALLRANELLSNLWEEGHTDGETLGLLARTHKDLALAVDDDEERDLHSEAAFEICLTGYGESKRAGNIDDAYYTGINAATLAFLRGDRDSAMAIASDVDDLCVQALERSDTPARCYWPLATRAEAALILGDLDAARERYAAAARLAGAHYGNLSTTRHQARLLLAHRNESADWLDDVMRVPPVLVFTGHMIDAPGRAVPRFEPSMEAEVADAILARVKKMRPGAAYGSAACGADILCLEAVLEVGGELHIVLPFPVEQFRQTSVDIREDGRWGDRFEKLLDAASEVLVISEQPPQGYNATYQYANLIMTGLARLRAQMLDADLRGLAVWDGQESGELGGTCSMVRTWRDAGLDVDRVALINPATHDKPRAAASGMTSGDKRWPFSYSIEAMMFADAVGYSRLTEAQVPLFFEHYAGAIAELHEQSEHKAVHVETAGDGMYMVFDDPGTAGRFALELSELVVNRNWLDYGLPEDLCVRIGLHCGPVFIATDPITRQRLYSGVHASRTARIEPITPPGQVYASSAFAAVATASGVRGLRFSYIGRTQLAKSYGVLPLYHVKPAKRGPLGRLHR